MQTYFGTSVPATHRPRYQVADGVRVVPPSALPGLWLDRGPRVRNFVIVGAGKTAMDVGVWLLGAGLTCCHALGGAARQLAARSRKDAAGIEF